jgi:hypothetical protein
MILSIVAWLMLECVDGCCWCCLSVAASSKEPFCVSPTTILPSFVLLLLLYYPDEIATKRERECESEREAEDERDSYFISLFLCSFNGFHIERDRKMWRRCGGDKIPFIFEKRKKCEIILNNADVSEKTEDDNSFIRRSCGNILGGILKIYDFKKRHMTWV